VIFSFEDIRKERGRCRFDEGSRFWLRIRDYVEGMRVFFLLLWVGREGGISIAKSRGLYHRHQWSRFVASIPVRAHESALLRPTNSSLLLI